MRVAVLGAGAGGQASAAQIALQGHEVTLYNRPHAVEDVTLLKPIKDRSSIELTGAMSGIGPLALVTNRIDEAVKDRDLIVLCMPAVGHLSTAEAMSPYLASGQTVLVHPGQIGSAWAISRALDAESRGINVSVTHTLLYACRAPSPGRVRVHGVKRMVWCAAFPQSRTSQVASLVSRVFPQMVPCANALGAEMSNMNTVVHPSITLANLTAIERGTPFEFYRDGVTEATARLLKAVDDERVKVCNAMNLETLTVEGFMHESYGVQEGSLKDMLVNNEAYEGIPAPSSLDHRYIWEDVTCGLIPLAAFADAVGVDVPLIKAMVGILGAASPEGMPSARTASWLGISGLDRSQIIELAHR